jgi:hypothetical protein
MQNMALPGFSSPHPGHFITSPPNYSAPFLDIFRGGTLDIFLPASPFSL